MSGAAIRIGQRLGLHHDGTAANLPPFETEMRRRLWWQLIAIDFRAEKFTGLGLPSWLDQYSTKLPSNVSDSDLSPTMTEMPLERPGPTEMIFCSIRYQVSSSLRDFAQLLKVNKNNYLHLSQLPPAVAAARDKLVDDLEARYQESFIKYCDPSVPLHFLSLYVARTIIRNMRLIGKYSGQYTDTGVEMGQLEKDAVFAEALSLVEYDIQLCSNPLMQGFLWHVQSQSQLHSFIHVIRELRYRTTGDIVERAWQQVKLFYGLHPEMITDTKNNLYMALGNMTVKAWAKREEALHANLGLYPSEPPQYILLLRSQRKAPQRQTTESAPDQEKKHVPASVPVTPITFEPLRIVNPVQQSLVNSSDTTDIWNEPDFTGFDGNIPHTETIPPVDWSYWQTLIQGGYPG